VGFAIHQVVIEAGVEGAGGLIGGAAESDPVAAAGDVASEAALEKSAKLTSGVDSPDIIGWRPKGALDYVLDRIVFGPGGRSLAD
jgi:hypothetical protein